MKTILAAATFIIFWCSSAFSQTPDTSQVRNKVLDRNELVSKLHADSSKVSALLPNAGIMQRPGQQEAPIRISGVQPVPMPIAKPDNRMNFSMPVAKPDSTVDFKLRIKKIGRPVREK